MARASKSKTKATKAKAKATKAKATKTKAKASKPSKAKPSSGAKASKPAKANASSKSSASKPSKASKPTAANEPIEASDAPAGIPFPFIGAGDASYFEWADLHVRFARAVTPAEKSKLVKTVPPPIGDVKWEGTQHLYLSSDQGVGRQIQAAYSKPAKQPTMLTTTSRFKMPDSPKLSRFNADTERWLLEAHGIVPIEVAFRRQDWEAGGTTLSPWHFASLAHGEALLASIGTPADGSTAEYLVRGIRSELDNAKKKATA